MWRKWIGDELSYARLDQVRRIIQIFTLVFLFLIPVLNLLGSNFILGTLYSISFGALDIADPVMALQTTVLSQTVYLPLLLACVIPVLLALIFGKVFCSWMCPYNTILELTDSLEEKFAKRWWRKKRRKIRIGNHRKRIYWAVFIFLVFITVIIGFPLLSYLSMPGIISTQIAQTVRVMSPGLEIGLALVLIGVESVVANRFWCKYICPVGAGLAFFRVPNTLHIAFDDDKCVLTGTIPPCAKACPLGLDPTEAGIHPYCYNCGQCLDVCEKTGSGALRFAWSSNGTLSLQASEVGNV